MDLQRKTLGQLMAGVLGIGNQSKALKVDAPAPDADASEDEAGDPTESEEDADTDGGDEADQEEAPKNVFGN